MRVPTRRVRVIASGHDVTINASEFNPAVHQALDAPATEVNGGVASGQGPQACPRCGWPDLRTDGPTFEQFVASGYKPSAYPPAGFASLESEGLASYRALSDEERQRLDAAWHEARQSTPPMSVDTTPGSIATVSMEPALALVASARTLVELDTLETAERANVKKPGGRTGILKAIEERRAQLVAAG